MEKDIYTTSKEPLVAIIVANYNGSEYIGECLESVLKCNYSQYIIILADDNSSDDSIKIVRRSFPDVVVLNSEKNGGYAHANNIGIQFAIDKGAEYVLLLNNDTVVEKSFLTELVLNSNKETIAVPYIFEFKHKTKLQAAGGQILWHKGKTKGIGEGVSVKKINNLKPKQVSFASGCCLLINTEIIKRLGVLREDFYMYFEDTDYSIRALKNNIKMNAVPTSIIYHKKSLSMGGYNNPKTQYYLFRNRLYFVSENRKLFSKDVYIQIFKDIVDIAAEGNMTMKKYLLLAVIDFLLNRRGKMVYWG
ncbi:MAG: glycosyltransferase family 2 protein [Lachnospiraceae bacterium]|nr:glycosyltransferase family 2 protein [Lachnospiraceae bacterium]